MQLHIIVSSKEAISLLTIICPGWSSRNHRCWIRLIYRHAGLGEGKINTIVFDRNMLAYAYAYAYVCSATSNW